ncbi:hypothetical protein [Parapedobacter sp. 2B3]|uniref:hypothetical protein n=1 Tax=Parapedobacter sp. 2B3 TaxID=3342381 RepID=UPI0035B5C9EE
MKKILTMALLGLSIQVTAAQPAKYSELMSETAMKLWPDSFSLGKPGTPAKWSYDLGVILKGMEAVWKASGDVRWFHYIQPLVSH